MIQKHSDRFGLGRVYDLLLIMILFFSGPFRQFILYLVISPQSKKQTAH